MATKRKPAPLLKAARARVKAAKKRTRRRAPPTSTVLVAVKRSAKEQLRELKLATTCEERMVAASAALESAGALQLGRDRASLALATKLRTAGNHALRLCLTTKR